MKVFIGIDNWDDVNWYLQQGYYITNIHAIDFPGYLTIENNLSTEEQRADIKKLIIEARKKGIKMTAETEDLQDILGLAVADAENLHMLSTGKKIQNASPEPAEEEEEDDPTTDIRRQQLDDCNKFFMQVAALLTDTHRIVGSSKPGIWKSACLVPIGTEDQLTYYGKPYNSLRVACNWNWRASLKKCDKPDYIQCRTTDLPYPRKRSKEHPEGPSSPIWGNMVGYYDIDQRYHCIFGERYDRKKKEWDWVESDAKDIADKMRRIAEQQKMSQKGPSPMNQEGCEDACDLKFAENTGTMSCM